MKTLRQRLTLTHTIVALLAVLIMALLASVAIVRAYRQLEQHQAHTIAQRMVHVLSYYYTSKGTWDAIAEDMQDELGNRLLVSGRRVIILNREWEVLFDSEYKIAHQTIPQHLRDQSIPIISPAAMNREERDGRPPMMMGEPPRLRQSPEYPPPIIIPFQEDMRPERDNPNLAGYVLVPVGAEERSPEDRVFLRNITIIVILGGAIASTVALVVALIMAKQVTTPIRSLTVAAQRLASGERHLPLDVPTEAELAELSHAFNTMAAELAHQEDIRRQFMADTAHELRTPLSVLRLQIEGLEDGIEQPTPETFASLHQEVDLLSHLIEDLRLLSLADAGRLTLALESLAPQAILTRSAAVVAPLARQHQIAVVVEPQDTPMPKVLADPQRLQQVLTNLLENALRYTPAGGRVTLRTYPYTPTQTTPNQPAVPTAIVFEVEDTGTGIAQEDLPHIFDRFYRTDKARTRELGGSGLGLAIVQRLVETQSGKVEVESTLGEGSCFRVILPVATKTMDTPDEGTVEQ